MLTPIAALVLLSLGLGVFGEPAFRLSMRVALQALDRKAYIEAVSPAEGYSEPLPIRAATHAGIAPYPEESGPLDGGGLVMVPAR